MIPPSLEILRTADGSATVRVVDWDEPYHSRRGAVSESVHVFIRSGLMELFRLQTGPNHKVLEVGFGTGLVAFLTAMQMSDRGSDSLDYTTLETNPLELDQAMQLNYPAYLDRNDRSDLFRALHASPWECQISVSESFRLTKKKVALQDFHPEGTFDLVLYDAFGPRVQPELWTMEVFSDLRKLIRPGGFLVTYCAKGIVKRAMRSAGLEVEALPGPPGKREMIRAWNR